MQALASWILLGRTALHQPWPDIQRATWHSNAFSTAKLPKCQREVSYLSPILNILQPAPGAQLRPRCFLAS